MSAPSMEWIEKVIRINTVTHQSNDELVRFLVPLLTEAGLKIEEQKVVENGISFKNIVAFSHSPLAPDLLVFNTHLDTVSSGPPELWTKTHGDPFKATRVRDRVYGLGTADVKIDFLCKIWAAQKARPWDRPFALVGTFGEERGLIGVEALLKAKKIKPRFAMVGEPSNLELIYAHKGHIVFTLAYPAPRQESAEERERHWKGKAAHSSTPALGENALRKGLDDIRKRGLGIADLEGGTDSNRIADRCHARVLPKQNELAGKIFELLRLTDDLQRELKKRRDARFTPSQATLSLNKVLRVDGELHFTFDIRTLPEMESARLKEKVLAIARSTQARVQYLEINLPLKGKKESAFMSAASRALKNCGVKPIAKTKASSTEAAMYSAYGAEAIVFGPGLSIGNVHRPNEYNSLRQIATATRFYSELLQQPLGKH